jgi:hypothetical protein
MQKAKNPKSITFSGLILSDLVFSILAFYFFRRARSDFVLLAAIGQSNPFFSCIA